MITPKIHWNNFFDNIKRPNNTILRKYARWLFGITAIPTIAILFLAFFFTLNSKTLQRDIVTERLFTVTNNYISSTISSIENQAYLMLTDTQVNLFIFSNDISSSAASANYTQKLLIKSIKQNNAIESCYLYSFQNNYLLGSNAANYIDNFKDDAIPWYYHYKNTGDTDFIIPMDNSSTDKLCMVRSLSMNGEVCAFVIFYIDPQMLFSPKGTEEYLLISNVDDSILYSTTSFRKQTNGEEKVEELYKFYKRGHHKKKSLFSTFIQDKLSSSNMTLVMNYLETDKSFFYIFIISFFIALFLATIFSIFFASYLTERFYTHISKTISYLTSETNSVYDNSQEEFDWIKNHIDHLLNSNKTLEQELSKSIIKLKNSHLAAMQMQSNPHFLFNALNLANMYIIAESGEENDASRIISLISDLLFASLSTKQYLISISDELSFAKKYIEIESIKYNHNFDVRFSIDENLLDHKTVRLTLQPLIENAFRHGIHKLPLSEKGVLLIVVKEENDSIIFKVCDNGHADIDKLTAINDDLAADMYPIIEQNIGLKNVNSRIKILFGEQYGCKIYRDNNNTISEIVIPKQTHYLE